MGTDIQGVFQRHDGRRWVDVASKYDYGRHYQLFAALADVRNGRGFAGINTGEPVTPIAEPRGLPDDFEMDNASHPLASIEHMAPWRVQYRKVGEPLAVWMGDHTQSWLTGAEMMAWFEHAPTVTKTGILDRSEYEKWDGTTPPQNYCGGITGPSVVLINDNKPERDANPGWTHIRCHWDAPLRAELAYFFDEVARLIVVHGRIRFVFGFDS